MCGTGGRGFTTEEFDGAFLTGGGGGTRLPIGWDLSGRGALLGAGALRGLWEGGTAGFLGDGAGRFVCCAGA